ncbi:hypothetical protein JTE90_008699 [Oedothorax gibbosus]|uniref:C3HC-type domain-containing protein n=1 Tax=Oedothorax gibbosus TaxID=931172 RepID=A0AAV6V2S8_9ARAC|nr:hypothetical protein JTE90_008699 [Oedothorax gibbosus]
MTEKSETIIETFFKTFSGQDSCNKDAEEFGKLVSTYIDGQKWVAWPLILSPAVCSQYGWKCINSNLLQCISCGAKLSTPEPKMELYDAYKACIYKILKGLKISHKTHCPWPLAPSPESFIKMVPMPKEESLKHFLNRLKSSLAFSSSFPKIKEDFLKKLGLDEEHILALCKLTDVSLDSAKMIGSSAVCLAATGWRLKSLNEKSSRTFIRCDNCQRSILTNSYHLLETSSNSENNSEISADQSTVINGKRENSAQESPSLRCKRLRKEDFDPISEHRPWCLWVISQDSLLLLQNIFSEDEKETPTNIPGWKIFIRSLLRNVCLPQQIDAENNPSKEEIRTVRNLLETWIDAVQ